jgi:predicted NAD/FAD-binding protein
VPTGRARGLVSQSPKMESAICVRRLAMTMISIAAPRDGDTVRELRRALNVLAVFQISDAAVVTQPSGAVKLQVPEACAEQAFAVLRDAGIRATRVRQALAISTIATLLLRPKSLVPWAGRSTNEIWNRLLLGVPYQFRSSCVWFFHQL